MSSVPHDFAAEESFIGAALLRQQIVDQHKTLIDPSDFYKPTFQSAWAAMLEQHEIGEPIDIVTVSARLRDQHPDALEVLASVQASTPSVSAAGKYADIIIELSRRRKLMMVLAELTERCYVESVDSVLAGMDAVNSHLILPRSGDIKGLMRLDDFMETATEVEAHGEWLIPHLFRPRWRVVLVASEGVGKGTLMRFLGLHAAAGRDPFSPAHFVTPRRVLYIDTENPNTTIAHQVRLANLDVDLVTEAKDHYFIWHREGGINLRDRRTRAEVEAVLQEVRPEIVFAGPLYKLTRRKANEDMEQSTIELLEVIDDFRVRFNFAIMIEHHAPKGGGISGHREMSPFGSSAILRWPEFGITLEAEGNPQPNEDFMVLNVGRFRRDRERADWPSTITRGGLGQRIAWTGRWPLGRNRFHWPY